MPKGSTSIYAKCRLDAGFTQEAWAEALEISVESVKAYELRLRVPPHGLVVKMVEISGCEWLALRHLQETAGCLDVVPQVPIKSLPMAVISLINKVLAFAANNRDKQLLQIAEDGIIDETERELFSEVMEDLNALIGAAYEVKYAQQSDTTL